MRTGSGLFAAIAAIAFLSGMIVMATASTPQTSPSGHLAMVEVSPTSATLKVGETASFRATAFDGHGTDISDQVSWSWMEQGNLGTIQENGRDATFTASSVGTGAIGPAAVHDGTSAHAGAQVQVVSGQAGLQSVVIHPPRVALPTGGSQQFTAKAFDGQGIDISGQVTWTWTTAGGIGTVDSTGLFFANTAGHGSVTAEATDGHASAHASATVDVGHGAPMLHTVVVTPHGATMHVGDTQQFQAEAFDQYGNPVQASFTWSVHGGIGTIDHSGLFTATHEGNGDVIVDASAGGHSVSAHVPVGVAAKAGGGALHSVVVHPSGATVKINGTHQFYATALDANGHAIPGVTFAWAVTGGIGTVDQTGLFTGTAHAAGEVVAEATHNGVTAKGHAFVHVTDHLVRVSGRVQDAEGRGVAGARLQFTAAGQSQSSAESLTDDQGDYNADIAPSGSYELKVTASGFDEYRSQVSSGPGDAVSVNAVLRQRPGPAGPNWLFIGIATGGAAAGVVAAAAFFRARSRAARAGLAPDSPRREA